MSPDTVGYTINSGGRGTLDLIWSCLATILLCTWTVQRLQVVPWSTPRQAVLHKKVFWFLITLLCPEYVAWVAFEQWQRARRYKELDELGFKDWTMQKGFYVDMGGLQIVLEGSISSLRRDKMNGDILELECGVCFTIRLDDLISLLKAGLLPIPDISKHDLDERSKTNLFARVITSFQIICFAIQCFRRLGSDLPISTLELSTLAFTFCAICIQYFWWEKPLDLRTATVTTISPENNTRFISVLPKLSFNTPEQDVAERSDFTFFFDHICYGSEMNRKMIYGACIGFIFNGIHVFAWDYVFASDVEQLLWRITSLGACVAIFLLWLATFIRPKVVRHSVSGFLTILYYVCRIYLMVEVFVGLRSVPEALYESVAW